MRSHRCQLVPALLLVLALAIATKAATRSASTGSQDGISPSKTSFLFMLIDDIGWADFGYNNGTAMTPNINAWVKRKGSLKLQDFHSGGTVCSPTRATVLTGRNHFRDCVDYVYGCSDMTECVPSFEFAPMRTFTVGDAIRMAGSDYDDGAFFAGKWHLGSFYNDSEAYGGRTSSPITHGFDHMNATVEVSPTYTANCQCKPEWKKHCEFGHYNHSNHCQPKPDSCCFNYWWDDPLSPHGVANLTWPTPDDDALYLADSFSRFLASRATTLSPFLAQISFHNCHIPFIGSKEAREACASGKTCRPPAPDGPAYTSEELDYYACLNQLDTAVGKVLSVLEREGYYDNTMVWFTSDNGPENNCPPTGICKDSETRSHRPWEGPGSAGPLRGRKRDIYEGGHRVPGVVSWPAKVQGENLESWETVVTMDFLPTVMDVLGVDRPQEQRSWAFDGRSIVPILQGKRWVDTDDGARGIGIGYYNAKPAIVHGWGYRYGRWKYVEGSTSCTETSCRKPQLYDLEADIGERKDLSTEYPDILDDLRQKFMDWYRSIMHSRQVESQCTRSKTLDLPHSLQGLSRETIIEEG